MRTVLAEVRLHERSARARLKARHHPYWRIISEGRYLGYYRGARAGTWIGRYRRPGSSDDYATISLGTADDSCQANGDTVLSWAQALDKTTEWIKQLVNGDRKIDPNMTVRHAVEPYITMRDERESARKGGRRGPPPHSNWATTFSRTPRLWTSSCGN